MKEVGLRGSKQGMSPSIIPARGQSLPWGALRSANASAMARFSGFRAEGMRLAPSNQDDNNNNISICLESGGVKGITLNPRGLR